jgi:hypothetical protein
LLSYGYWPGAKEYFGREKRKFRCEQGKNYPLLVPIAEANPSPGGRPSLLRGNKAVDRDPFSDADALAVGRGIDFLELDLSVQHLLLAGAVFRLHRIEFRHHLAGEEFKAFADVLMPVGALRFPIPQRRDGARLGARLLQLFCEAAAEAHGLSEQLQYRDGQLFHVRQDPGAECEYSSRKWCSTSQA